MDKVLKLRKDIYRLREQEPNLTPPSKFFTPIARNSPMRINRIPSYQKAEPVSVDVSDDKNPKWFYPTISEWQRYLQAVKKEIEKISMIDFLLIRELLGIFMRNKYEGVLFYQIVIEFEKKLKVKLQNSSSLIQCLVFSLVTDGSLRSTKSGKYYITELGFERAREFDIYHVRNRVYP